MSLKSLVADFSAEMYEKLRHKQDCGWGGWNEECQVSDEELETDLMKHIGRARSDPKQWIDVANYAAFLWRRAQRREVKR